LRLVGRTKHEINRGGIKIPAEEVDALLERHPDVVEACAFALPDALSGETVAAAIVLEITAQADRDAIRSWCETMIRRDAVPSKLFVLPVLPRTDRGKLNRDVVRQACLDAESAAKS
jgi:acyl-CoA synthetase (AMP-forming)/AMP-acid ligase II